jgi:hypothetical protein
MLGFYEHENTIGYKLAVFSQDDGYLVQFVQGVNLVVQNWYQTIQEVVDVARKEGFDISGIELKCNKYSGKVTIDYQWQTID